MRAPILPVVLVISVISSGVKPTRTSSRLYEDFRQRVLQATLDAQSQRHLLDVAGEPLGSGGTAGRYPRAYIIPISAKGAHGYYISDASEHVPQSQAARSYDYEYGIPPATANIMFNLGRPIHSRDVTLFSKRQNYR
ncbi:uncharacterized protein [Macrobrachium rosenbergii]|uniref:uncharacterized protein n=1 Tax=Macrobrachium rosenbergii TaxID=79674 RepID=UPI0034D57670